MCTHTQTHTHTHTHTRLRYLTDVTLHRTTATGVHLLMARIGAIVGTYMFGQFSYADPTIPIIMVAVVMLIGTIAALPLPRTNRRTALK